MSEGIEGLVPTNDDSSKVIELLSLISSAVPYLGGPLSNILSGQLVKRRFERVDGCLRNLATRLDRHQSDVTENYVKTEEFDELLEQTLRRVSEERNEEKRKLYQSFLYHDISLPQGQYDDKMKMLRLIEQVSPRGIMLLKALNYPPDPNPPGWGGSPGDTLRRRLDSGIHQYIPELLAELNRLGMARAGGLNTMMTSGGAEELHNWIQPLGTELLRFIESP
ncbi:MAG: hypothetical protein KOO62_04970 [candidate division Zixibacteria bacterium]|nr:hypothetical protein [candidate division Zixibacteria bacterium]